MMILPFGREEVTRKLPSGNNRQSVAAENTGASSPRNKKDGRMTILLSRRGDSNTRPPRPERGALPTALLLGFRRKPRLFLRNFLARFTLFSQKRVQKYCFFLTYANNFAFFRDYFALFLREVRFAAPIGSDLAINSRTSASVNAAALIDLAKR